MKLEDIDKKNPFLVPDGYFESFPDLIMARIKEEEKPKRKIIKLNVYLRKAVSIAAIIIIFFMIGQTDKKSSNLYDLGISQEELLDFYSTSELEDYIISELYLVEN